MGSGSGLEGRRSRLDEHMSMRASPPWIGLRPVFIVALALSSCRDAPDPRDRPSQPEPFTTIDDLVTYAGCAQVWLEDRPRCVFEPGKPIRLWLDRPEGTEVTVTVDGHALPATTHIVPGMDGFRLEVIPDEGAEELVVELPRQRLTWSLPLRTRSEKTVPPPGVETSDIVYAAIGSAYPFIEVGQGRQALTRLTAIEDRVERYPKGKAAIATHRGIAYWNQGRFHDAAASLGEGVSFAVRLHDSELIADAIHMYAGVAAELGYWDAAVEWSDRVLDLANGTPELIPCGQLARIMSTVGYAHLLRARYRGEPASRARSLLEKALKYVGPAGSCPEPGSVPGIVLSLADEALDRNEPNEALGILQTIDIDAAPTADQRLRLYDARARALDGAEHPLAERDRVLAQLEHEVTEAGLPEGRWRLELRRGDLLRGQGRLDVAIAAYRRAEEEALAIAELAAVGIGRESTTALHARSTERLVGLLVEQGRPEEALCSAREAQARRTQGVRGGLSTDEQRQVIEPAIDQYQSARSALDQALVREKVLPRKDRDALHLEVEAKDRALAKLVNEILLEQSTWRPSCADLSPRRPGELLLGLYPGQHGWLVFVQDDMGTEARILEGGPTHALHDPSLGAELLEPLSERLAAAKRVRVLSSGRAQQIDVHLLLWRGAPLLEHAPVTYGAELPRSTSAGPPDTKPNALLLADPTETLRQAPKEVMAAAGWMTTQGWTLDVLTPDEADRARVHEALARSSLFYFAGHGVHARGTTPERNLPPYAGGSQGWPAHLRLKSGSKLEIHDILMLRSAPTHVALLGCETGVPSSAGGGMSLALAFLVAGAQQVVATPVETTEEISYATGVGLLSGMSDIGVDLAAGLREAQLEMLRSGAPVGRYRVWVR